MYIARNMSCILSNEMKDKMLAIYKGEVPSVIAFEEMPKCIASECTHWKFGNNKHGFCSALDGVETDG